MQPRPNTTPAQKPAEAPQPQPHHHDRPTDFSRTLKRRTRRAGAKGRGKATRTRAKRNVVAICEDAATAGTAQIHTAATSTCALPRRTAASAARAILQSSAPKWGTKHQGQRPGKTALSAPGLGDAPDPVLALMAAQEREEVRGRLPPPASSGGAQGRWSLRSSPRIWIELNDCRVGHSSGPRPPSRAYTVNSVVTLLRASIRTLWGLRMLRGFLCRRIHLITWLLLLSSASLAPRALLLLLLMCTTSTPAAYVGKSSSGLGALLIRTALDLAWPSSGRAGMHTHPVSGKSGDFIVGTSNPPHRAQEFRMAPLAQRDSGLCILTNALLRKSITAPDTIRWAHFAFILNTVSASHCHPNNSPRSRAVAVDDLLMGGLVMAVPLSRSASR